MPDSMRYNDWLDKAKADLSAAKILFEHKGHNSIVCFHCQQAIEKALKSFILKNNLQLIEGHSLVYLCKKSAGIDIKMKQYIKDCAFVNQFYLETRYPADVPLKVDDSDAQDCIDIAQSILEEVNGNQI